MANTRLSARNASVPTVNPHALPYMRAGDPGECAKQAAENDHPIGGYTYQHVSPVNRPSDHATPFVLHK